MRSKGISVLAVAVIAFGALAASDCTPSGDDTGDIEGDLVYTGPGGGPCIPPSDTCIVVSAVSSSVTRTTRPGCFCCPPSDTCAYHLSGLPPGSYILSLAKDSMGTLGLIDYYHSGMDTATSVTVTAGSTTDGIDIVFP